MAEARRIEREELQFRQHLSFGDFVSSSPYPTWCKDYSNGKPIMLWISRSYETIFNVDRHLYEGFSDKECGYWSDEVCEQFLHNDHRAIEMGMFTDVEHIGTGIENWRDCIVTKWSQTTEHFDQKLTFVYGLAVPLNGRDPERVRTELRPEANSGRPQGVAPIP